MSEMLLLARAYEYAARMHSGQTRKGLAAEPYINHPCEVAALLAQACGGTDTVLIAGGVLHDIVEDTAATQDDLVSQFGDEIHGIRQLPLGMTIDGQRRRFLIVVLRAEYRSTKKQRQNTVYAKQ